MKNSKSLNSILISILFLALIFTPQKTLKTNSFNGYILWNTGYSNFISYIKIDSCHHSDPGGTLEFPKIIFKLCSQKQNSFELLHEDRFHNNFKKHLLKLESKEVIKYKKIDKYKYSIQNDLFTSGHLDKLGLELFFLKSNHLNSSKHILLPNHGQPQYLDSQIMDSLKNFKMIISGSQSRSYTHHKKTESKFKDKTIPIVYKNIWGHLVFEN